jgi:hypothetical protein
MWNGNYKLSVESFNTFKPSRGQSNAVKCMWRFGDEDMLEVTVERDHGEGAAEWEKRYRDECRAELDKYMERSKYE